MSRLYDYAVKNRFKRYTVFIGENFLHIYRGDAVDPYKQWDLWEVELGEAKEAAAQWLTSRIDRSVSDLLDDWKVRLQAPYLDTRWLDECYELPAI